MALTKPTFATNNIASLSETPNITEGLSALQLQQLFDKVGVDIKTYLTSTLTTELDTQITNLSNGWIGLENIFTYTNTDGPMFTVTTSIDTTSFISPGTKFKLTQTSTKYFIAMVVTDTTIIFYGGTDYTLLNASITGIYYSKEKIPFGFPISSEKWTITYTISASGQANPTANTWYNMASILVYAGAWKLPYNIVMVGYKDSTTSYKQYLTLSTTNNGSTDNERTSFLQIEGATGTISDNKTVYNTKDITLTTKTTLYLNTMTPLSSVNNIGIGITGVTQTIKAICNYL